ncbi:MAG: molybdate ABC transporter substrate-binding protein [Chloroflexota bacterium]
MRLMWLILCLFLLINATSEPLQVVANAQNEARLTVFAASSLTDVFTDIAQLYEDEYSDTRVTLNFAGSSTLATQIEQGAPADIFASANTVQMQRLIDGDLVIENSVTIFAENQLALIVPADNPADIISLEDIANPDVTLVLAAPDVPVRVYTDTLLATLGDSFLADVEANIVSNAPNVRQVVTRIAFGDADAGIVYQTDITPDIADDVLVIPLPDDSNPRAEYPIATISESNEAEAVEDFIAFLLTEPAQAILHEAGFCTPPILSPEMTPEPTPDTADDDALC